MNNIKLKDLIIEGKSRGESSTNSELEQIAKKYLGIKTLKTQNRDSEDFHDLAVWNIKSALRAAYKLGHKDNLKSD